MIAPHVVDAVNMAAWSTPLSSASVTSAPSLYGNRLKYGHGIVETR